MPKHLITIPSGTALPDPAGLPEGYPFLLNGVLNAVESGAFAEVAGGGGGGGAPSYGYVQGQFNLDGTGALPSLSLKPTNVDQIIGTDLSYDPDAGRFTAETSGVYSLAAYFRIGITGSGPALTEDQILYWFEMTHMADFANPGIDGSAGPTARPTVFESRDQLILAPYFYTAGMSFALQGAVTMPGGYPASGVPYVNVDWVAAKVA